MSLATTGPGKGYLARSAAGAELRAVKHVEVDMKPPAPGPGRDLPGGLPARLCRVLVKWRQVGRVSLGCCLARLSMSRARTSPMAGSWLAGSGSGRCAWIW